jgi:ABC-type branched-subunit amino acid transport system ATPase component
MNQGPEDLQVEDVTVTFGGVHAVDRLNLTAAFGRLTAVIGPNGAGKTTTFNVCSGLVRPTRGRVVFDSADVTQLSPAARARRGLGRTFQRDELFGSLTVAENVALGREAALAGTSLVKQFRTSRAEREQITAAVDDALATCGIDHLRSERAANLSTGQRRLVELARILAGGFRMLLLDEPSAGLDSSETSTLSRLLLRIVKTRGTGILLVEHDMSLVMDVSEFIYVLDFGKLIYSGTPGEVVKSEVVQKAYLGTEVA